MPTPLEMNALECVCEECGAINHEDAETCWRCLATLVREPAASAQGATATSLA